MNTMVGKNLKPEQLKQIVDRTVLYLDKVIYFEDKSFCVTSQ